MVEKIIYMYVFRLCRKTKYPDRAPFLAVWFPKVICLLAFMRLYMDESGYVHCDTPAENIITWAAIILLLFDSLYIFHFSSLKNHDRTEKEVERALRESPGKWKMLIALYWVAILLFLCIVCHIA